MLMCSIFFQKKTYLKVFHFWKTSFLEHLLLFFEVPGGRKSTQNWSGNSNQRKPGSKSVLGGSGGRFWSHSGVILGPKIDPEEGPKTSWIWRWIVRGPQGRSHPAAEAPLGSRRTAGEG